MKWLRWFIAGALAVPLFHQVILVVLNVLGWIDRPAFGMAPTAPLGVPQLISLAFWGGVWGVLLGILLERVNTAREWLLALVFGAIAPTLVAGLLIAPLKGAAISRDGHMIITGLLINAAWGLGTALIYRLLAAIMPSDAAEA